MHKGGKRGVKVQGGLYLVKFDLTTSCLVSNESKFNFEQDILHSFFYKTFRFHFMTRTPNVGPKSNNYMNVHSISWFTASG